MRQALSAVGGCVQLARWVARVRPMQSEIDIRDAAALLDWYREMGVDASVAAEPTNWLEQGDSVPGAGFRLPSVGADALSQPPAARLDAPSQPPARDNRTAQPAQSSSARAIAPSASDRARVAATCVRRDTSPMPRPWPPAPWLATPAPLKNSKRPFAPSTAAASRPPPSRSRFYRGAPQARADDRR